MDRRPATPTASHSSSIHDRLSAAWTATQDAFSQITDCCTSSRLLRPALAGTALYLLRDQIPSMPTAIRVSDSEIVGVMADHEGVSKMADFAKTAALGAAASAFAQSMYEEVQSVWGKDTSQRIG